MARWLAVVTGALGFAAWVITFVVLLWGEPVPAGEYVEPVTGPIVVAVVAPGRIPMTAVRRTRRHGWTRPQARRPAHAAGTR